MSALAVRVSHVPAAAASSGPSAPANAPADSGFAALLGKMTDAKSPAAADPRGDSAARAKSDRDAHPAAADATTASTLSVLQSLEAALTGLGARAAPASANPAASTRQPVGVAALAAAPVSAALAAVTGALDGSGSAAAWDASGKTPLKALLQADPTLGFSDFQMKTHLAAAGATPTRAGGADLRADSAWRPLNSGTLATAESAAASAAPARPVASLASTAAETAAAATPSLAAVVEKVAPTVASAPAVADRSPAPRAASQARATPSGREPSGRSSHAAAPLPIAFAGAVVAANPASGSSGAETRKDGDTASGPGAVAAAGPALTDPGSLPTLTVPLAQLPAFIADQANSLAAPTADAAAATNNSAAPATQAKAAQAVKELNIALDPGDLGQMTLKLRLAGGKLSVTIEVADPRTLAVIEGDRSLIAARLVTGDQTLEDLVIQRQGPTTSETVSAHASSKDSGSPSSEPDSEASDRPGDPSGARPRRGGGGAFSDLLV